MTVCPVYQTTLREADVARGRLALLERAEGDPARYSSRFEEILSRCLLCGACAQVCANSVETNLIIQAGRHWLFEANAEKKAGNPLIRSIREGKPSGGIISKGGALLQALICKTIPESSGLHLRFPFSFFTQRRTVPAVSWVPFLKRFRPQPSIRTDGGRIGFFVGCGANFLFPEAAQALVRIVRQLGFDPVIPTNQICCGLPAFASGNTEEARALAKKNIEAFQSLGLDVVLTVCASCGSFIRDMGNLFDDDPSWRKAATAFSEKHQDAMAFLVNNLEVESLLKRLSSPPVRHGKALRRVAYHDPCHLRIGQGISDTPRKLLSALPNVEFVEAPHAGQCCGHGGEFNLSHFDLSVEILDRRMADFQDVAPDAIVSGCTGCLLQFQEGISRHAPVGKVQVCHPLVVVERALAFSKKGNSRFTP